MQTARRHLILNKGDALFIYGYDPGQESRVLEILIEQAKDERSGLDWFDVAVLEAKLEETAGLFPGPQDSAPPDRFQLPSDGPLWFMRDGFGPDGNRHAPG